MDDRVDAPLRIGCASEPNRIPDVTDEAPEVMLVFLGQLGLRHGRLREHVARVYEEKTKRVALEEYLDRLMSLPEPSTTLLSLYRCGAVRLGYRVRGQIFWAPLSTADAGRRSVSMSTP